MSIFGNRPPEDDRIRPEIKALIARGNVTAAELAELRMNSWERDALVPAMTDEALIERLEYALANCFTGARPFSTYNQAVEGLYAPELIKRFKSVTDAFRDLEEAITVDRAATGRNSEAWDALQKIRTPPATAGDAEGLSAGDPGVAGGGFLRTPEGPINNCALANNDVEQNCQVCNGRCPDREAFALAKEIAKKPGVYESTLTDHVFPELFSGKK